MKDTIPFPRLLIDMIPTLSDNDSGILFKALLQFSNGEEPTVPEPLIQSYTIVRNIINFQYFLILKKSLKYRQNVGKRWGKEVVEGDTIVYNRIPPLRKNKNHLSL